MTTTFAYTQELIDQAYSYAQYKEHIGDVLQRPTSEDQAAMMLQHYTGSNARLMAEFDATYKINDALAAMLAASRPVTWLVITEGWCGDAAFISPLLHAAQMAAPDKVNLRFALKDKYPELMDAHLTNGGRSIPKLIILNEELEELATWGPRPAALQTLMPEWKAAGYPQKELILKVHHWYRKDDTVSTQEELTKLVRAYSAAN
jgi:hypothetical protein